MACSECKMLRGQIEIAREEVDKLRDRIAADLTAGRSSPRSLKSLQAADRSLERAIASLERHLAAHIRDAQLADSLTFAELTCCESSQLG